MSEHTKGPWELADTELGYPENMLLIPISERRTAFYQCYAGTAANARLIAAVPEYDALLELALKYLEHPDVQAIPFALPASAVAERIREARAKAND